MKSIRKLDNSIDFIGIGGPEMEKEGLSSLAKLKEISVVGFWEVAWQTCGLYDRKTALL